MSLTPEETGIWCATAKIVAEHPYGPNGEEIRRGSKHFRGGAKVYVIDAYWGMGDTVTVVGHHRKSGRFISLVYSPTIQRIIQERFARFQEFSSKENAEKICAQVPKWNVRT